MAKHVLKTVGYCWDAVASGAKTFEVRKNDRGFQPGDTVQLVRLRDNCHYGYVDYGKTLTFKIGWMLQGGQFGIEPGYCVFSLERREADSP